MNDAVGRGLAEIFAEVLGIPLPDPDVELISSGLLDSMSIVTLVVEIEDTFDIEIATEDLDLTSFSTVRGMAQMIRAARPGGSAQPAPRATERR